METKVSKVEFYSSGAYIEREGTLRIKKGSSNLLVDAFSSTMDTTTVTILTPKNVTVSNIQCRLLSKEDRDRFNKVSDKAEKELCYRIEAKKKEKELLDVNSDFSCQEKVPGFDIMEYLKKLTERKLALDKEVSALEEELSLKRNDKKKTLEAQDFYRIYADFDSDKDGDYPITIRYFETAAFWNQLYEIHADTSKNTLLLKSRALVKQTTKENFKDCDVWLYTGNPHKSLEIPELDSEKVRLASSSPVKAMAGGDELLLREAKAMVSDGDEDDTIIENAASMEYRLTGKYLLTKGESSILDISCNEVPCEFIDFIVPQKTTKGYLCAKVKTSDIALMHDSKVSVYCDGVFCGTYWIEHDFEKEEQLISLGRDLFINCLYERTKQFVSAPMLKGQKKEDFEYKITIASTRSGDSKLICRCTVPVSTNKEVVVDNLNISNGVLDKEKGIVEWNLDINGNQNVDFVLGYTISWPKNDQIEIY